MRSICAFEPGWKTIRSRIIPTAAMPSEAVSALAATGRATVREVAVSTASETAARAAARITRSATKPSNPALSQAPKSVDAGPTGISLNPLYQSKKKSAISRSSPPSAAITSPRLSLPRSTFAILLNGPDQVAH